MPHIIVYLDLEQVLAIHHDQIERHGGSHGIRDLALLESAVARPQVTFGGEDLYTDVFLKAAVVMHGIILNHPFLDGNKRTGTVSAARFLFMNGYILKTTNAKLVEVAFLVESKKLSTKQLADWLKKNSKKRRI